MKKIFIEYFLYYILAGALRTRYKARNLALIRLLFATDRKTLSSLQCPFAPFFSALFTVPLDRERGCLAAFIRGEKIFGLETAFPSQYSISKMFIKNKTFPRCRSPTSFCIVAPPCMKKMRMRLLTGHYSVKYLIFV